MFNNIIKRIGVKEIVYFIISSLISCMFAIPLVNNMDISIILPYILGVIIMIAMFCWSTEYTMSIEFSWKSIIASILGSIYAFVAVFLVFTLFFI